MERESENWVISIAMTDFNWKVGWEEVFHDKISLSVEFRLDDDSLINFELLKTKIEILSNNFRECCEFIQWNKMLELNEEQWELFFDIF